MIDMNTIRQIQAAPVADRIRLIELILQSLKGDLDDKEIAGVVTETGHRPFAVHRFNLGEDIHVDRDDIHADRLV